MRFKRIITLLILACVAFPTYANDGIEALYVKLLKEPDVKTADKLNKLLFEKGESDSAQFHFKGNKDPDLMMYMSLMMSYYYYDNADYRNSIKSCETSLKYADEVKSPIAVADSYLQMSTCYMQLTDYQNSNKCSMKAVRLAEQQRDNLRISISYYNLAYTYLNLHHYKTAWKYLKKSIEAEKSMNDPVTLSMRYGLAAELSVAEKKYDNAIKFIEKAIELAIEAKNDYQIASHQLQAVDIYYAKKEFKKAAQESENALKYFEHNDSNLETIICFKQHGMVHIKLGNTDKAIHYLRKAEKLSLQLKNKHQLLQIYESLSEVETKHNPLMALKYLNLRDALKDSIFSEETNRLVSDAEVKYETSQKELKIQEQQNEMKTRQMWFTVCIATAIVIILLIIVYVSINNSRKNKRHAAQLKVERDEATAARDEATKARDEAERANALKGVFIDNVVHELRTPINAIQGFSQLLDPSFGSSPEEVTEYLGIINDNCNSLITIVQDTIDVSEMENASYPVHPTPVQMSSLCKEVVDSEQHRLEQSAGAVNLSVAEKEDFTVCTDRSLLTRLLTNLVSNACKYTPRGSITVEFHKGLWSVRQGFSVEEMMAKAIALQKEAGPAKPWNLADSGGEDIPTTPILVDQPLNPNFIEPEYSDVYDIQESSNTPSIPEFSITVTDTGCGIAPENAEKIFNRFEKLGSYIQGNGMGLTIVRLIAHLLHGNAYLDTSYTGNGSRFVVELPSIFK